MVAMPQWTDQPTNAKYIADVWHVGVRVKANEKGIVTKEEVEGCIREVMEGERGNEMRRNSEKWMKLAKTAVDEGGSSDKNITEFAAELARKFNEPENDCHQYFFIGGTHHQLWHSHRFARSSSLLLLVLSKLMNSGAIVHVNSGAWLHCS